MCPGRSRVWWLPDLFLNCVLTFRGQKGAFGCVCGEAWRVCVFAQVFLHAPCLEEPGLACAWTVVADNYGQGHGHAPLSGSGAPLRSHLAFSFVPVVLFMSSGVNLCLPLTWVSWLWPSSLGAWLSAVTVAQRSCRSWCSYLSCPPDRTAGQQRLPRDHTWLLCFNGVSLFHGLRVV